MASHLSAEQNPNWKGGRVVASNGYVLLLIPGHHLADVRGYVYEHRVIAEQNIGRRLRPGEQVHHINSIKTDNRPENIDVVESIAHHRLIERRIQLDNRRPGESNPEIACACGCGGTLHKFDKGGRPRRFISGHNTAERNRRR